MPVIHNRGKLIGDKSVARKITFPKGWDKEGFPLKEGKKILTQTLMPNAHMEISAEQLKHLKENFHDEIININDLGDMQAQFKEKEPEKAREGYLSPAEVDAVVARRVAEELEKKTAAKVIESREDLIARIDAMDRGDLIALIEKETLPIEHKNYKAPGSLKAAVLEAIEQKDNAAKQPEKVEEAA